MSATYTLNCATEGAARTLAANLKRAPGLEPVTVTRDGDSILLTLDNPLICGLSRVFGTAAHATRTIVTRVLDAVRRPAVS